MLKQEGPRRVQWGIQAIKHQVQLPIVDKSIQIIRVVLDPTIRLLSAFRIVIEQIFQKGTYSRL